MALNPREDTEFNDALRKHGILPPRESTPPSSSPPSSPTLNDILPNATPSELKELEEEDHNDSDTERMIAAYRRRRLADMRNIEKISRFGELYPIGREDYTTEVTDASKIDVPGETKIKGTGVVCLLFKDGQVASTRLAIQLKTLAKRHPATKFVSIVGDKCIPNYADNLCPTLIVYRGGDITRQVVAWGADRERTLAELEAMLIISFAITAPHPELESERKSSQEVSEDNEGESLDTPRKSLRSNVHQDDYDSDFDL